MDNNKKELNRWEADLKDIKLTLNNCIVKKDSLLKQLNGYCNINNKNKNDNNDNTINKFNAQLELLFSTISQKNDKLSLTQNKLNTAKVNNNNLNKKLNQILNDINKLEIAAKRFGPELNLNHCRFLFSNDNFDVWNDVHGIASNLLSNIN